MTETPGTSKLTEEQTQWYVDTFGVRYVAVADGSYGGHTPDRAYGEGRKATSIKTKRRA